MNELEGVKVFLSGAMDLCDNDGIEWRREFREKATKAGLGFKYFDPTDKPDGVAPEIGLEKHAIKQALKEGDWEFAAKQSREVRHVDLRMIDSTNLYIVYIDLNTYACGTWNEFFVAEEQQKPQFVIMAPGFEKYDIPLWLVGIVREDEVFAGIDDCIDHLVKINAGQIEQDDRWLRINV